MPVAARRLRTGSVLQGELDLEDEQSSDRSRLMTALDALNSRYGRGTVQMACTGVDDKTRKWGMKKGRPTPQYTTQWEDVPVARA